jgi:hypothetical protein
MRGVAVDDNFVQSFYPIIVAADMAGYHPRTVQKLIQKAEVQSRKWQGRRLVHLGSLLRYRVTHRRMSRADLRRWLRRLPAARRDRLTYPELAVLARAALHRPVSKDAVYRAWIKAGLPRRRCPKRL